MGPLVYTYMVCCIPHNVRLTYAYMVQSHVQWQTLPPTPQSLWLHSCRYYYFSLQCNVSAYISQSVFLHVIVGCCYGNGKLYCSCFCNRMQNTHQINLPCAFNRYYATRKYRDIWTSTVPLKLSAFLSRISIRQMQCMIMWIVGCRRGCHLALHIQHSSWLQEEPGHTVYSACKYIFLPTAYLPRRVQCHDYSLREDS